jgi:hypothetical protein
MELKRGKKLTLFTITTIIISLFRKAFIFKRILSEMVTIMPKVEIEIPEAEYEIFAEIAKELGLPIETLVQQEIDQALTNISVWVQRAEMLSK